MENASKALIIAGAILLAILIIGIGMSVFRSASGVMSSVNMDEQEIATFNEQFTFYAGNRVSGTKVRQLLNALASNYRTNSDDASKCPQVVFDNTTGADSVAVSNRAAGSGGETDDTTIKGFADTTQTAGNYKVEFGYDPGTNIVTWVHIDRN